MIIDDVKTIVIFRKFNDSDDIIALFPAIINYPSGNCESYQKIGQHGAADYNYCMRISKSATPQEYNSLKYELEGLGYNLNVKKRFTRK